jgi:hypothetical protein
MEAGRRMLPTSRVLPIYDFTKIVLPRVGFNLMLEIIPRSPTLATVFNSMPHRDITSLFSLDKSSEVNTSFISATLPRSSKGRLLLRVHFLPS